MTNKKALPIISLNYPGNKSWQYWNLWIEVVILILHQILLTNLQGYVSQLEGRINNQILGVGDGAEGKLWAMDWFSLKSSAQRLEGILDLVESNTVANLTSD